MTSIEARVCRTVCHLNYASTWATSDNWKHFSLETGRLRRIV